MKHCKTLAFLLLLLNVIWAVPQRSTAASFIEILRHLAQEGDKFNPKPIQETSPSPSPLPGVAKSKSGYDKVGANPPNTSVVDKETCDRNFKKCHDDVKNVTACILAKAGDAPNELFLLVHNYGEGSVRLSVTVLPGKTYDIGDILGHAVKKINVSSNSSRISPIVLNAADWTCRIEREVRIPRGFPSYTAYVKPLNAAYLLFATALLIGFIWACCKLGRDDRHLNGVPYRELEMGQQESSSPNNMEILEGWDQSWDDDWDEEQAVKSPGANHTAKVRANGDSSRSTDSNGWGNDWND